MDRRESPDEQRTPSGLILAAGVLVVVVTALVTAPLTAAAGPRVGAMVAAVLLFTATVGDGRAAVGVAVIAWAIGNGFLINQRGELHWHAPIDNWFTIGLLTAVAVGMSLAEIRGEARRRRRWRPLRDLLETAAVGAPGWDTRQERYGMAPARSGGQGSNRQLAGHNEVEPGDWRSADQPGGERGSAAKSASSNDTTSRSRAAESTWYRDIRRS